MNRIIDTPILLIGFNRPQVIKESFVYLKDAKPTKLYVAIDGPRKNVTGEEQLVEDVKKIVKQVDWDCDVKYKFNEQNLGAEITISAAISWVFDNEETLIVLEDDIIAPVSFLNFAQEMLQKYAKNNNIYMVSSCQTTPIDMPNSEDYLFSVYGHTGGWATWKRAWNKFDLNIDDFNNFLDEEILDTLVQTKAEKKYWISLINCMKKNGSGNNNWDYCWSYIRFKEQGLSIVPRTHLSSNIGTYGLHARGATSNHFMPYDDNFEAVNHPLEIKQNIEYDKHHFNKHINHKSSLVKRAYKKVLRILKLK